MKLLKSLLTEMPMGRSRDRGPYDDAPRGYKIGNPVRATELVAGMAVAATYNKYNHGTDFVKVLGFNSGGDDRDKVVYRSVRELMKAAVVSSLRELESHTESHMVVQEILEDGRLGDKGGWYYPFEGRWARGSGAEPLSFAVLTPAEASAKGSDRDLQGEFIVFTGFRDPELARKAQAAGARVQDNFTKQTSLVVAVDPNSQSGKARRAREQGARVIGRHDLESMLAQRPARQEWDRFANESVQPKKKLVENVQAAADRLEEIKDEIKALATEAITLLRRSENEMTYERAKAYWYPHIVMALDKDHGYMGGSMHSMEDSVRELRDADDEHDEALSNMDDEDEREAYVASKRAARRRPQM